MIIRAFTQYSYLFYFNFFITFFTLPLYFFIVNLFFLPFTHTHKKNVYTPLFFFIFCISTDQREIEKVGKRRIKFEDQSKCQIINESMKQSHRQLRASQLDEYWTHG